MPHLLSRIQRISAPVGCRVSPIVPWAILALLGALLAVPRAVTHAAAPAGYDEGPAIPLPVDAAAPTVVTKLLVTDCRAVRGFLISPVDGKLDSFDWSGHPWEYNQRGAGAGVGYSYRHCDGLHVTLADRRGVQAVVIRGGARCKLYDTAGREERWQGPGDAPLLHSFLGGAATARAVFARPVRTDQLSFFDVADGALADMSFLRWRQGAGGLPAPAAYPLPDTAAAAAAALEVPLAEPTALAAVGLDFRTEGATAGTPLSVRLSDPLNPRSELMAADFTLAGPGRVRLVLDFPDQILPAASRLSLRLFFATPVRLVRPTIALYRVPQERALPEALAYRKLMMKGLFSLCSEQRPWNGWTPSTDVEAFYRGGELGPQLRELAETIAQCKALAPADDTVRQYDEWFWQRKRGLPRFTPRIDRIPGAPEWAVVARQAWLAAREVPRWWIEHRMVPTGEFGSDLGDDTDMYQNYADFPMFETDGVAAMLRDGAEQLAELAEAETLEQGVNKRYTDPLHAYEEGVNHEGLMAFWHYGDPVYLERCMTAARSLEALTVVTPKGHRHFRNQRLGAADLRTERPTDVDGQAHPFMLHPALELAWYNRHPRVMKLLREWGDGWLEHQLPGQYAIGVDVASETPKEVGDRPLGGGFGSQGAAFNFLFWITGEERYLRPFFDSWKEGRAPSNADRFLPELLHRHGLRNLGDRLPAVIRGKGAAETIATGNKAPLIAALKEDIAEMQRFPAIYTTSEPWTDRVFLYALSNAAIAYTGGYATRLKFNHTHAASWEGFGTEYAAWVLRAAPGHFKVLLYNFAARPRSGHVRLWTLEHGRYQLTLGPDSDGDDRAERLTREETVEVQRATALPLTLPAKTVVVLELQQTERLEDGFDRADLALSPRETHVRDGAVEGVVHNIGARDAEEVAVALVDARGRVQARQSLGRLPAPLDLAPRRIAFHLSGLPREAKGWKVVVDPGAKTPEIFEGNNVVAVGSPE